MSHRAMNWALEQRHLKPGPWVVLIKLADRHNKDTLRVDPEQSLLAVDCNMARSSVNRHLTELEELGLLLRVPRLDPRTQKQLSTFYVLGIDFVNPPEIDFAVSDYRTRIEVVQNGNISGSRVPIPDTGAVSQKTPLPCPKKRDSRVPNWDTNLVREPVREPCASETEPQTKPDFEDLVDRFVEAYPRLSDLDATRNELQTAIEDGADPEHLVRAAKAYREEQKGNPPRYVAYSENWLRQKRWNQFARPPTSAGDQQAVELGRVKAIREGQNWIGRHITSVAARDLVARELVTAEQCKAVGIQL